MTLFDSTKLNPSGPFIHATDALANKGQIVSFYHLLSGRSISFKAFITAFNETYNCDWDSSTAYGRTDPVYVYKNAKRAITIGLKIPAATLSEGYENLLKLQNLLQFLYPKYKKVSIDSRTISQSPLVRLRLMNLVKNQADVSGKTFKEIFTAGETQSPDTGLLGFIKNVAISHNLETDVGVLEGGNPSQQTGEIIPKLIEVTIDFTAIHEHHLGWQTQEFPSAYGDWSWAESVFSKADTFPYGIDFLDAAAHRATRAAQPAAATAAAAEPSMEEMFSEIAAERSAHQTPAAEFITLPMDLPDALSDYDELLGGALESTTGGDIATGAQADSDQATAAATIILDRDPSPE
jgi:hypothetical protein